MTEQEDKPKADLVKKPDGPPPAILAISQRGDLDLSELTPEQQKQIRLEHAKGVVAADAKARDVAVDAQVLDKSLETLTHHAREASKEEGMSVTITNVREDKMGRTETIIGNTETASKGKLSRSQTGGRDLTWVWVLLGIVVIAAIVIIAVSRS